MSTSCWADTRYTCRERLGFKIRCEQVEAGSRGCVAKRFCPSKVAALRALTAKLPKQPRQSRRHPAAPLALHNSHLHAAQGLKGLGAQLRAQGAVGGLLGLRASSRDQRQAAGTLTPSMDQAARELRA